MTSAIVCSPSGWRGISSWGPLLAACRAGAGAVGAGQAEPGDEASEDEQAAADQHADVEPAVEGEWVVGGVLWQPCQERQGGDDDQAGGPGDSVADDAGDPGESAVEEEAGEVGGAEQA